MFTVAIAVTVTVVVTVGAVTPQRDASCVLAAYRGGSVGAVNACVRGHISFTMWWPPPPHPTPLDAPVSPALGKTFPIPEVQHT